MNRWTVTRTGGRAGETIAADYMRIEGPGILVFYVYGQGVCPPAEITIAFAPGQWTDVVLERGPSK